MSRLIWVGVGFLLGVVVARNAAAMRTPVVGAVILGAVLLAAVMWWAGVRDKKAAVAVAVAKATAVAVAQADARAAAIAQAAVHLHLGAGGETDGRADASSVAPRRLAGRHAAGELVGEDPQRGSDPIAWSTDTAVEVPQVT